MAHKNECVHARALLSHTLSTSSLAAAPPPDLAAAARLLVRAAAHLAASVAKLIDYRKKG